MDNSKYGKHIVQTLQLPARMTSNPERMVGYAKYAKRILWMDAQVVPGAFQMNTSWYTGVPTEKTAENNQHSHNSDEIIGFFSGDPQNPNDLGGEIEFWIEDEMHLITKTSMIFIPRGMKHCPLIIRRVDRPIFHYSVVTEGQYNWVTGQK